jgi:uncharacterized protein YdhG (YjbR/CyaY superfamily)
MSDRSKATTIDEYIAEYPPATRIVLERMRAIAREEAPDAVETISYAIPTFDLNGKHLVHFAAFEHHVGLYPTPVGMAEFAGDLKGYKTGKGSVQFPLDKPLPEELIRRIIAFQRGRLARA